MAALVTGAGGGIGRIVVAALLAEGATVVAFDAAAEPLESARATWDVGERVQAVVGDVGDADQVAAAFAAAERTGRPLAALAACAGVYPQAELTSTTDADWQRVQRINLRGVFLSCQAAARAMVPHRTGAMVTMSSGLGFTGAPERAAYAASKAGVAAFTKSLALEMAPYGIRANAIAPGVIDTPMPRQLPGRTEGEVQQALIRNPLQRIGTPRDVANLIVFLLSTRSAHITGQVLHINGGTLMP